MSARPLAASTHPRRPTAVEKTSRRRYELAQTAIRLFADRGYENVTSDDIATAAGVGVRTFFRYFATKEDAAFPDHEGRIARFIDDLDRRRATQNPLQAVADATRSSVEEYFNEAELYRPRYRLVRTEPALRDHERIANREYELAIVAHLTAGPGALDTTLASAIAGAMIAAVDHVLDVWATESDFRPAEHLDILDQIVTAFGSLAGAHPPAPTVIIMADDERLRRDLLHVLQSHRQRDAAPDTHQEQ